MNRGNEQPRCGWGPPQPFRFLDESPAARAPGRRPCPEKQGRPTPSAARFARHSRRGKPAQPSALDAPPALAPPAVSSRSTWPGFPRLRPGAPGRCPPDGCRSVGGPLAAGATSVIRLPPSL